MAHMNGNIRVTKYGRCLCLMAVSHYQTYFILNHRLYLCYVRDICIETLVILILICFVFERPVKEPCPSETNYLWPFNNRNYMKFEAIKRMNMEITILWDVKPRIF
jgi:hypothetical protein